jgi:hypothetical protein
MLILKLNMDFWGIFKVFFPHRGVNVKLLARVLRFLLIGILLLRYTPGDLIDGF